MIFRLYGLQWDGHDVVAFAARLDQVGDEEFDHKGLFVERAAQFIHEEDMQAIPPSTWAAGKRLHRNSDLGSITLGWDVDGGLLHDKGVALKKSRTYLDVDKITFYKGAQSGELCVFLGAALYGGFLEVLRIPWFISTHQLNTDGIGLVGLHPQRCFDNSRGGCCVLLFAENNPSQLFKQRAIFVGGYLYRWFKSDGSRGRDGLCYGFSGHLC